MQRITMYLDESGLLNAHDRYVVYGGLVFTNKNKMRYFAQRYMALINQLCCGYCEKVTCDHHCPEVKHYNTQSKHKNMEKIRFLLTQSHMFFVAIDNSCVYDDIMATHASRRTI